MSIENLLAQGYQSNIEPYGNALMRAQEFKAKQQANALMQMQAQDMHAQRALALQQAQQQAAQQAQMNAWRQSIPQPQGDPRLQALHGGMAAGAVSPVDFLKEAYPKQELMTVAPGASLVDKNKPTASVFTAPIEPKASDVPGAVREYQFAVGQGYKGTFEQWDKERKRAGATNVTVTAEKTFAQGLGKQAAEALDKSSSDAQSAQGTLSLIGNIRSAIGGGDVILGPGATARQGALRVGQIVGAGSKGSAETLARTKQVEQGLAGLELEAAQLMKGQGQITEAERGIIRRAAAGQIQDLTPRELEVAMSAIERNATKKIAAHKQRVTQIPANAAPGLQPLLSPAPATAPNAVNWGDLK